MVGSLESYAWRSLADYVRRNDGTPIVDFDYGTIRRRELRNKSVRANLGLGRFSIAGLGRRDSLFDELAIFAYDLDQIRFGEVYEDLTDVLVIPEKSPLSRRINDARLGRAVRVVREEVVVITLIEADSSKEGYVHVITREERIPKTYLYNLRGKSRAKMQGLLGRLGIMV